MTKETSPRKVPDLTPPTKAASTKAPKAATEAKTPKPPKEKKESQGAGAPRPRKHEYGIKPDATIHPAAGSGEAAKRAGVATKFALVTEGQTVEQFYAAGGDRHDLRVMSRRGLITIKWATGETFPQAAVAKPLAVEAPKGDATPTAAVAGTGPATV